MIDYQLQFLLEYMANKYDLYSYDLDLVKNRIQLYSISSDDLLDLIVTSTRVDTASTIFREIRELLR